MIACSDQFCINAKLEIPIVYTFEDSNVFYQATLCKRGNNCLCFETGNYIEKGKQVYVMTEDYPIDDDDLKIYEGCFGQVGECQKSNRGQAERPNPIDARHDPQNRQQPPGANAN